jgi:hypothetical protein
MSTACGNAVPRHVLVWAARRLAGDWQLYDAEFHAPYVHRGDPNKQHQAVRVRSITTRRFIGRR